MKISCALYFEITIKYLNAAGYRSNKISEIPFTLIQIFFFFSGSDRADALNAALKRK